MSDTDLKELLDKLESQLGNLEQLLKPLTSKDVATTTKNLPILDQAKLNVLTAYTANTLIFSAMKVSGQDPRQHAVFGELARTRHYFGKIKEVEEKGEAKTEPRARIDVAAAGRFIKAGLSGNDRLDASQRANAKRKLDALESNDAEQPRDSESGEWEVKKSKTQKKQEKNAEAKDQKAAEKFQRKRAKREAAWKEMAQEAETDSTAAIKGGEEQAAENEQVTRPEPIEYQDSQVAPMKSENTADRQAGSSTAAVAASLEKTGNDKKNKKQKKKSKKSNKAPRGANEVMQDLLKKGNEKKKPS